MVLCLCRIQRLKLCHICLLLVAILVVAIQLIIYFFQLNYDAVPNFIANGIYNTPRIPSKALMEEDRRFFYASRSSPSQKFVHGQHRTNCGCPSVIEPVVPAQNASSTCSIDATNAGLGQRIISYSLFIEDSDATNFFLGGLEPNLHKISIIFPNWNVRIYTNIPINKYSCDFICKYKFLYWCDIQRIPGHGNLSSMNGRVWRYLVLGDPTVDMFLSRDLDSTASERERIVVTEWENSDKAIHVIRDSHWHDTEALAGLWGMKNTEFSEIELQYLQKSIIRVGSVSQKKFWDQEIVERYIYFPYVDRIMSHDSYFCTKYPEKEVRPFPIQRIGQQFVGHDDRKEMNRLFVGKLKACPIECRPSYGKDWTYC